MAAPVASGRPQPMAPPVICSQSCGAAPQVSGKKPRPKETLSSTTMASSGSRAATTVASPSGVGAPRATSGRGAAVGMSAGGARSSSARARSAASASCSGRASTVSVAPSGWWREGLPG